MKKKWLFVIIVMIFFGAAGGVLINWFIKIQPASAQAQQRYVTESLGITRGNYLVADLASFPDGATKLILRDPQGRIGLVLAVYDRPGYQRARIEFYDAEGNIVRTLDASPVKAPEPPASPGGRTPESLKPSEAQWIQDQIDDLRRQIGDLRKLITK